MPAYEQRSFSGNASATTITAGIGTSDTSISIASATGWPTTTNGPFYATLDRGLATEEKIKVTVRSGTSLTVERGADDTSASTHSSGAAIEHTLTATDLEEANTHIANTALDHHTQYLNTTRHDVEARHTFGAAYGTPVAPSDVSTAASAGTGNNPAREDHVHDIAAGAIDNANKFAAGVVDETALASNAVTQAKIGDDAVGANELADNAVAKANIQDDAVGPDEIDTANLKGNPVAATGSALDAGSGTTFALANHVHTGGIAVVTAATRPGSPYEGQVIYETDTNLVLFYDGSAWRDFGANNRAILYNNTVSGSAAASWDVSDISQNYQDLEVVMKIRSTQAANNSQIKALFNNDSSSLYTWSRTQEFGVTYDGPAESELTTSGRIGSVSASTAPADTFGWIKLILPDYASATRQVWYAESLAVTTTQNVILERVWGVWNSATAVSRLTISPVSGSLDIASEITISGVNG